MAVFDNLKTTNTNMKNYAVMVTAWASVVVLDAESEQDAIERATDGLTFGKFMLNEAKIEKIIPDTELERAKRHAEHVVLP